MFLFYICILFGRKYTNKYCIFLYCKKVLDFCKIMLHKLFPQPQHLFTIMSSTRLSVSFIESAPMLTRFLIL